MDDLIQAIKQYQEENSLSDGDLAKQLGITRSLLSLVKRGKREPGAKMLRALVRNCPELTLQVMNYLAKKK